MNTLQQASSTSISSKANTNWDMVIRNAKVFDGSGTTGKNLDLAVLNDRIAALGENLPVEGVNLVHDAQGGWLTPGLLDIHTHEDLEAELDPGLPEVVRHGTTSVLVGNCSLGIAFGAQRVNDQDPIVDCFARVENIPKEILRSAADKATWNNPRAYLEHIDELPLSANIAPFLPHSMLRIEVMGLQDSITRDPTPVELDRMAGILEEALQDGYLGLSTDGLPVHFLANQPNVQKRIPTQYAKYGEYKKLTDVVRKYDRVWQMTPATDDKVLTARLFMLSSGRIHGKPLKVTALAVLDTYHKRQQKAQAMLFANLLNNRLFDGNFRLQCLAAPFRMYTEGAISPIAEGNSVLRSLAETELDDTEARRAIIEDPEWLEEFGKMWAQGKAGWNLDNLRRKLRISSKAWSRDLREMMLFRVPVDGWIGKSLDYAYQRYLAWLQHEDMIDDPEETACFNALGKDIQGDGDFFVKLLHHYDRDLYWSYVDANKDPKVIRELLFHPKLLPGFNDSGAHLTNMAYYDGNLRALNIAIQDGEAAFSHMVRRLTREPAEFFGLNGVGSVEVGQRADMVVINPTALKDYDGESNIQLIERDVFGCEQMVNRSDRVVDAVFVGGQQVWAGSDFTAEHGTQRLGQALRVNS